jgi:hypothetical protein
VVGSNRTIIADLVFNKARYIFEPRFYSLPLLDLDLSEDRINEALQNITLSAIDTSFLQTLVTTTGSARLRQIAAKSSGKAYEVPESVKETRIRYGYMLGTKGEEVVRRWTSGLEDEVEDTTRNEEGKGRWYS